MQEQLYTNPENPARAPVVRRSVLAALAGGAIAIAAPAAAKCRHELDLLIDQADAISRQIDIASDQFTALSEHPDRPLAGVEMEELADGLYSDTPYPNWRIYSDYELIKAFSPYLKTSPNPHVVPREIHYENRKIARQLMSERQTARQQWDDEFGVTELDERLDRICGDHARIEEKIWAFPCKDFSVVATKIAYLDRTLGDQIVLTGEVAMGVIWSLGGLPPKPYGPI